jgi:hypothetical protein
MGLEEPHRGFGGGDGVDNVTVVLEGYLEHAAQVAVVFDQKNAGTVGPAPLR